MIKRRDLEILRSIENRTVQAIMGPDWARLTSNGWAFARKVPRGEFGLSLTPDGERVLAQARQEKELVCRRCARVLGYDNVTGYHPKCMPGAEWAAK